VWIIRECSTNHISRRGRKGACIGYPAKARRKHAGRRKLQADIFFHTLRKGEGAYSSQLCWVAKGKKKLTKALPSFLSPKGGGKRHAAAIGGERKKM